MASTESNLLATSAVQIWPSRKSSAVAETMSGHSPDACASPCWTLTLDLAGRWHAVCSQLLLLLFEPKVVFVAESHDGGSGSFEPKRSRWAYGGMCGLCGRHAYLVPLVKRRSLFVDRYFAPFWLLVCFLRRATGHQHAFRTVPAPKVRSQHVSSRCSLFYGLVALLRDALANLHLP